MATTPNFPNGFDSWIETYYEFVEKIVDTLNESTEDDDNVVSECQAKEGRGGLYELAKSWTTEFEEIHRGIEWDGNFFDAIETFLNTKFK